MNRWRDRSDLEHQVMELLGRGTTQRRTARALGVSRGVVQRIAQAHSALKGESLAPPASPEAKRAAPRPSKLDAFEARIRELLTTYPAITAERIFEELREAGYGGGRSIVKERVSVLRPPPPPKPSRERAPVGPGEEGEQDWSPHTISFLDGTTRPLHAFLLVLSHSRRRYVDFFERVDQFALLEGHRRAFAFFDGVPGRIRYDRQSAVVARLEGRDVIYQPRLVVFATHYGFEPFAVRPYHPNDKAFVERDLWDVERSFLNGRRFRDLEDLRAQARRWLTQIVDERRHPTQRDRRVIDVFTEELPALRALPAHPYDTARLVYRLVTIDGFVAWEGNHYSVPYAHVTALCPVRITQDKLFVYGPDLACVAEHALLPKGLGRRSILEGHRPPRLEGPGAHIEQIRAPFCRLCNDAAEFLEGLIRTHPRSAAYHARCILELRERYSTDDVACALVHALRFQAFSSSSVTRIVETRARPRTLDEYVAERTEEKLRGLLQSERMKPRDLATYDRQLDPPLPAPPPTPQAPTPQVIPIPEVPTPQLATTTPISTAEESSCPVIKPPMKPPSSHD